MLYLGIFGGNFEKTIFIFKIISLEFPKISEDFLEFHPEQKKL